MGTPRRLDELARSQAVESYMSGSTVKEVARRFAASEMTIYRVIYEAGIKPHKGRAILPRQEKECTRCKNVKPFSAFSRACKRYRDMCGLAAHLPQCKQCAKELRRERGYHVYGNTGVRKEAYDALLMSQGRACLLCGSHPEPGKPLQVDHDHATHEVRGLLCGWCNFRMIFVDAFATDEEAHAWLSKGRDYRANARTGLMYKKKNYKAKKQRTA